MDATNAGESARQTGKVKCNRCGVVIHDNEPQGEPMTVAIKERPIIFSGPMVRAILDGTKTQTRRVVTFPSWLADKGEQPTAIPVQYDGYQDTRAITKADILTHCKGYEVGDHLWVRESFTIESFGANVAQIRYKADNKRGNNAGVSDHKLPNRLGGVPSIHMPRHCSRIDLLVQNVAVERLQDISERDARAEGVYEIMSTPHDRKVNGHLQTFACFDPQLGFALFWDDLNAKRGYSWDSNPWVWKIEFTLCD